MPKGGALGPLFAGVFLGGKMAKKLLVLALSVLAASAMWAQEPESQLQKHASTEVLGTKKLVQGPTYADVYCAGYIAASMPQPLGNIAGGWYTPHQDLFGTNDYVYLKGSGFELNKTYEVIRPVRDLNHMRQFDGQK